ncbi:hypothetical protein [Methylovirgula sp. 4M-Z18]|uniref:hypothetical protein n=1 Tax=Methylovirgula sp. 4M-Z18 TaxID=2293567 RepID=UPI000E2ECB83|nr:hypothetical protein [Methylovirgula sp. 4M-Z18]RFB80018.1 hypothetical protein DYH55_00245 [Methylovirgula sp. 4M-Z18]
MQLASRNERKSVLIWGALYLTTTVARMAVNIVDGMWATDNANVLYLISTGVLLVGYTVVSQHQWRWKKELLAVLSLSVLISTPTIWYFFHDGFDRLSMGALCCERTGISWSEWWQMAAWINFFLLPTIMLILGIVILNLLSVTRPAASPVGWRNMVSICLVHALLAGFIYDFVISFAVGNP